VRQRPPDRIVLTPDPGIAVYLDAGLFAALSGRGRRVLLIGVPSVHGLTVDEFRAILAHEYGHFGHADTRWATLAHAVDAALWKTVDVLPKPRQDQNQRNLFLALARAYNLGFWVVFLYQLLYLRVTAGFWRLREVQADVLVCYLPVGSEDAARFYAQAALDAKVAFVNALPVFIASDPEWAAKFEQAGVPIIGDDIKSQVGATITHRVMAKLFEDRGVVLDRTYQLNVGGNMDFKNMLERDRLESKKVSKTQAVTSNLGHDLGARNVHIGPSDYVQWLDDRKWAYVRLEGRAFGDVPLNLEYKLEVWDSPNSAGIIIDAIRAAKIAKDRGVGGPLISPSSYLMKSPPVQRPDDEGRAGVEAFIRGDVER